MAPASEAANPVLTIQGLGGTGTDVTAFVDKVEVIRASDGTVVSGAAGNLGFETYGALGNGDSDYGPVLGAVTPVDGGASLLLAGGSAPAAPAPRQIAACRSSSFCPRCFVVAGAFFWARSSARSATGARRRYRPPTGFGRASGPCHPRCGESAWPGSLKTLAKTMVWACQLHFSSDTLAFVGLRPLAYCCFYETPFLLY